MTIAAVDSGTVNGLPVRHYTAAGVDPAPVLVMAHGAGAGQGHPFMCRVAGGLAGRGVTVVTFDFPYMARGRRVPDRMPQLEASLVAVVAWVRGRWPGAAVFAGGKSMGGRVASRVAADRLAEAGSLAGLVLFGYPLHPPGRPDQLRVEHLPRLSVPVLVVQGARDEFGSPAELEPWLRQVPGHATLHVVDDGNHSLEVPRRCDPGGERFERALDRAGAWIRQRAATGPAPPAPSPPTRPA
jgi:hypothetical protein